MRCYCCDVRLTPREACTIFAGSRTYTEMCDRCLTSIDAEVIRPKREFDEDDAADED